MNQVHKRIVYVSTLIALSSALTGCLQTRSEVREQEEKQVLRKQVTSIQQTTADINTRFQDVDDDIRKLSGRVEAVEAKTAQASSARDKGTAAAEARAKETDSAYREEFNKLNGEIDALKAQVAELLEAQKRSNSASSSSGGGGSSKSSFEEAEANFEKKAWKDAILDYERYRKANTKGKQFATATYKIGVSFQELGMADEARAFYEEVISKFPKSKDAGRASTRLKSLNKKK